MPGRPVRRRGGAGGPPRAARRIPRTGCVARVASLDTRGPASRARAAPRGRRADERDADAGVRRRKTGSVDASKRGETPPPPPPAAPARPRCRVRGVTVAWVVLVGYQAKGFIHRENTAHGDPCDSPETLPLAHAHW